uniref:Reverse transcriptase domain-containing protein n=1 Tax=Oryzias latipes TaxID=8090 RepID=A0A3B3HB31_ORYLA
MPTHDKVIIAGDFNIHVCCPDNLLAREFLNIIDSFNLDRAITGSTHIKGHTLDIILTCGISVPNVSCMDFIMSDHKCILFSPELNGNPPESKANFMYSRVFNSSTAANFGNIFSAPLVLNSDANSILSNFNSATARILDQIAPFRLRKVQNKNMPWMTDSIRNSKRICRRAERKWKASKSSVDLETLKNHMNNFNRQMKKARSDYFSQLINTNRNNPRVLFKVINQLSEAPHTSNLPTSPVICEQFANHFINKISNIRSQISITKSLSPPFLPTPPARPTVIFEDFQEISPNTLSEIVYKMKPCHCSLDIMPVRFFKEIYGSVSSHILFLMNTSLSTGTVPDDFKAAMIQPLLKKPSLDPSCFEHYRPISKLPFLAKILEKLVAEQVISFLNKNKLFETLQSGFKANHSTETALLRVMNDLLMAADSGKISILVLLDLSAAFDTVDHSILLQRLKSWVGFSGTVFNWFYSYLSDRFFNVFIGNSCSSKVKMTCGVPQGSVLGPLLFSIYMLPLGEIIRQHNLNFHFYADDTQLYLSFKPGDLGLLNNLNSCIADIKTWMAQNFLQLNMDKTDVIIFGSVEARHGVASKLESLSNNVSSSCRNLGVIFDTDLNLETHVKSVVKSCFWQLHRLYRITPFLSKKSLEMVIHAFIFSRLDYCNALYTCLSQQSVYQLQLVQNAAARLITGTRMRDHITPVLASLHWLPVSFRIDFKILLIAFKALCGLAPKYIADLLTPYVPGRNLRSLAKGLLTIPQSRLKTRGDRAFAVRAPTLWNSLPEEIRLAGSLPVFKSLLKTYLFRCAFNDFIGS